ncbi:MAG: tRNA(5-methylaminomethyl-2-thiouridylate) methyltransferase [Desulfovibrio sp.]|jgi:hypothetical protein|nr:tRNA(5-methylaminomethyl-2-thiouridylate) methyltransferase [Desulfovibrio sp.]
MEKTTRHKVLALFSGGLDSLLAARLIQEQGLEVLCLHFVSPFFGTPAKIPYWSETYGLAIEAVDIADDFVAMLKRRPVHGFGSALNPCVDCKILMMRRAAGLLAERGASCLVSGEVLGQRPMSQRRDTLNVIRRDAGVKDLLLRPLSALLLGPTPVEEAGIVDRARLLGLSGRGRKAQRALAERFGLKEKDIPNPAGGCRLTERENARSYWPVLVHTPEATAVDFHLANTGRQFWLGLDDGTAGAATDKYRLIVGRKQDDNSRIMELAGPRDLLLKARDFPGPVALGRFFGRRWPEDAVLSAAALTASYSTKAAQYASDTGEAVAVRVHEGSLDAPGREVLVTPSRAGDAAWREGAFDEVREGLRPKA